MTQEIKNTETVTIETEFHNGDVWNQTLTNRKTGDRFVIGLFQGEENVESEWNFDVLRELITENITSCLPVDPNAHKRLGICKVDYHDYQMQCEFTFEPWPECPDDGWYVENAWVLSAIAN